MKKLNLLACGAVAALLASAAVYAAPDTTGPDVFSVTVDAVIKSGSTGKIIFEAKDDLSGITDFIGSCESVYSVASKTYAADITAVCGMVKPEGKDKYSLDLRVGQWVVPGKYSLRFDPKQIISDKAKNRARSGDAVNLVFEVVSDGHADTTGPEVSNVSIASPIKAGTTGKITFEATDDLSGVTDFIGSCESVYSLPARADAADITAVCGMVTSEGGNKYSLVLRVGQWVAPGKYALNFNSQRIIFDKAKNLAKSGPNLELVFEVTND
jgi:hypothetical protein